MARIPIEPSEVSSEVNLDRPIEALNKVLAPLERVLVAKFEKPQQPLTFIVGAPRSGTTLLSQLIIAAYRIGYVSNLVARFWKAPFLGMQLFDELREGEWPPAVGFSSDLGFTLGYEGPHEFGYFWRRWFDYGDTHCVSEDKLSEVNVELLRRECAGMQSVHGTPFLFKNLVCSFQIGFLAEVFPQAVFVHCRRKPLFVAQSLLQSRRQYCNSKQDWFSVKPEAFPSLRNRPYADQIAGQIYHTRRHVEDAFGKLSKDRFCHVDYEKLIDEPRSVLRQIAQTVERKGGHMRARDHFDPPSLRSTNEVSVDTEDLQRLKESCRQFFDPDQIE